MSYEDVKYEVDGPNAVITISDRAATVLSASANQVTFVIPAGLATGPAILKFSNGVDSASIAVALDAVVELGAAVELDAVVELEDALVPAAAAAPELLPVLLEPPHPARAKAATSNIRLRSFTEVAEGLVEKFGVSLGR